MNAVLQALEVARRGADRRRRSRDAGREHLEGLGARGPLPERPVAERHDPRSGPLRYGDRRCDRCRRRLGQRPVVLARESSRRPTATPCAARSPTPARRPTPQRRRWASRSWARARSPRTARRRPDHVRGRCGGQVDRLGAPREDRPRDRVRPGDGDVHLRAPAPGADPEPAFLLECLRDTRHDPVGFRHATTRMPGSSRARSCGWRRRHACCTSRTACRRAMSSWARVPSPTRCRTCPPGIHVAIVDPGVGTDRRALVLASGDGRLYVGPDNGLLDAGGRALRRGECACATSSRVPLPDPSPTFHGRDVFAPAGGGSHWPAASLVASGEPTRPRRPRAPLGRRRDRSRTACCGAVCVHVDRFGNCALAAVARRSRRRPGSCAGDAGRACRARTAAGRSAARAATFADVPPGALVAARRLHRGRGALSSTAATPARDAPPGHAGDDGAELRLPNDVTSTRQHPVLAWCGPAGEVAQLVEHSAENRGVAGSSPALATSCPPPIRTPCSTSPCGPPARPAALLVERFHRTGLGRRSTRARRPIRSRMPTATPRR